MSRVIADVTEAPEAVFARTDVEVRNYLMSPSLGATVEHTTDGTVVTGMGREQLLNAAAVHVRICM